MKKLFYERGEDNQEIFSIYRYPQLVIVALAGVVISFLLYNSSLQLEVSKLTAEYNQAVESRVNALQKELYHSKYDIITMASFFSSSQEVTGEEFRVFTEPLLEYTQSFQALYWAPLIRNEVRDEYEAAAHRGNYTEPGISELDGAGQLVPAGQRDEYFPVYYVEPYESNRMILGYDLASGPASYKALARSRDTGEATFSSPVKLIQTAGQQNGFLVLMPVYRKNAPLRNVEDRRRNLLGFGIGAFRAVDFVTESFHHLHPVDIETRLLDVTNPENPVLLCQLRGNKPADLITIGGAKTSSFIERLHRRLDIDIGGRIWRVESSPTKAFISLWRTPTPLLLLIIGLFATSLFVGFAILNIRNNHQVRQFAQAQTTAREELIREVKDHKRTEEKLHLMHNIVEQADDSIAVASKEGYIQYCNPSWAKMHRYETPDELLGKHLSNFHTEDQMQKEVIPFNEKVMKDGAYQGEVGHKRQDGTTFPTRMTTTLMKNDDDNVIGITGIARDITERKRAEEALRESERSLSEAQRVAHLGSWDWDVKNNILYMSDEMFRIFGLTPQEFKANYEVFMNIVHSEDRDSVDTAVNEALERHLPYNIEYRVITRDNGTRYVHAQGEASYAEGGEPIRMIGTVLDITERKQFEKALEESERKFRSVVESAPNIIALLDREGVFTFINSGFHDIDIEKALGTKFSDYLEPSYKELAENAFRHVLETGLPSSYVSRAGGPDGSLSWYETKIGPILGNGEVIAATLVATDITELKRAEEVLQEANKTLEEMNQRIKENYNQLVQSEKMASIGYLAAGVAHEINNPVGFVKSNLGTLADYVHTFSGLFRHYDTLSEAISRGDMTAAVAAVGEIKEIKEKEDMQYILSDVDDLLKESLEGTERVKDIVQNLKSFARADEGRVEEADINEGIEATLKVVWNELKYKCTVNKKLGALPLILCNLAQLNQVFMNLLVNAAHAIEEKGDITIETEAVGENIIIRISDTGVGIPPKNLRKLFDPFFTTKPPGKGTGLGLSISDNIIRKHNGTIDVESKVGQGTTFIISLPAKGIKDEK